MTVVSIKFKGRGKTYFFDPNDLTVNEGEQVVVETSKGLELAVCVQGNHEINDERIVPPLRPVVRIATADDLRIAELCKAREKEAFGIAEEKIAAHGLDMKLVDVECNFEGSKILFFFTSDGRVDFRELVKDLAGVFRTRIELRQIGVRDEAKMLGGLGICGLPFCCHQFMDDFQPVSTKMAKTQSLSLNPAKISGSCGRLMCCLRYEQEAYEELVKGVPKSGAFVETTAGYGNVTQVNLLRQTVKVKLDSDESVRSFESDEVAAIPGGRPRPGEPLPHILKPPARRKPEPEEPEEDKWVMPPIFAEDTANPQVRPARDGEEQRAGEEKRGDRQRRRRSRGKKPGGEGERKEGEQPRRGDAPKAAAEGGEKKNGGHRRHKPSGGEKQNPPREKAEGAQQQKHRQKPHPKPEKPAAAGGEKPAAEGGEKKNGGHRRHYRPRNPGKGGGQAGA